MNTLTTSEWTHPTTGEVRRYLDPAQVADLWIDLQGRVSKADIDRIECGRYWLDSTGTLVIERLSERGRISKADLRAAITAALR